ncbi:MAG TPA: hypothetical protein VJQ07_06175 [Gaiellaceae bacterium]|nr:hypothetical protein [Gaiellaceae bacterium]
MLEQRADQSFRFPVCLWPVRARLADGDFLLVAGVLPAAFEAGAVVGEHALDLDPVPAIEADALGEEGDCRGGGLVGVDACEGEPAGVVDRDEQVLPARETLGPFRAVACDAVAGTDDPAELLDVDVQQLAGPLALVADDLTRWLAGLEL